MSGEGIVGEINLMTKLLFPSLKHLCLPSIDIVINLTDCDQDFFVVNTCVALWLSLTSLPVSITSLDYMAHTFVPLWKETGKRRHDDIELMII